MQRTKSTQHIEKPEEKAPHITEILENMREDQRQLDQKVAELENKARITRKEKIKNS